MRRALTDHLFDMSIDDRFPRTFRLAVDRIACVLLILAGVWCVVVDGTSAPGLKWLDRVLSR